MRFPPFLCRELGQPVRLFSENVADIRERLRRFIAAVRATVAQRVAVFLLLCMEMRGPYEYEAVLSFKDRVVLLVRHDDDDDEDED